LIVTPFSVQFAKAQPLFAAAVIGTLNSQPNVPPPLDVPALAGEEAVLTALLIGAKFATKLWLVSAEKLKTDEVLTGLLFSVQFTKE
jgi:hypothetical protein